MYILSILFDFFVLQIHHFGTFYVLNRDEFGLCDDSNCDIDWSVHVEIQVLVLKEFLIWKRLFNFYSLWVLFNDVIILFAWKSACVTSKKHRLVSHERNLQSIFDFELIKIIKLIAHFALHLWHLLWDFGFGLIQFSSRTKRFSKHFIHTGLGASSIIKWNKNRLMILIKVQFKALRHILSKIDFIILTWLHNSLKLLLIKYSFQFKLSFVYFSLGFMHLSSDIDILYGPFGFLY